MEQAALLERYTTFTDSKGKAVTRSETVLILTTASPDQAPPADLLALNRGHWAATEATHYIRDVDLKEDSSLAGAPGAARFMATVGNAALNLLRIHGVTNIARRADQVRRTRSLPTDTVGAGGPDAVRTHPVMIRSPSRP